MQNDQSNGNGKSVEMREREAEDYHHQHHLEIRNIRIPGLATHTLHHPSEHSQETALNQIVQTFEIKVLFCSHTVSPANKVL